MMRLKSILMIILCIGGTARADQGSPQLFNYSIILDAQRKCDPKGLSKLPLALNRKTVYSLAKKAIVVVSDLSLKEVSRKAKAIRGQTRDFELLYTLFAQIGCDKPEKIFENGSGLKRRELPVVAHAWKDPSHLEVVTDNVDEDIFAPSLIVQFTANDLPPEAGLNGLACLIEKSEFIKGTPKAIALKICGIGASAATVKNTAATVEHIQKVLGSDPIK